MGWEGSAADGRVLRDIIVRRNGLKVPRGNYYLCDGEYTNGNGFLSPYRVYRYWLKDWQGDNPSPRCREELFNMKHARIKICSPTKRRSNMSQKMARVWTQKEELTLVDGLKKLCAYDWKEDNGTFKYGYLMELEQHMNVCHPNCGLQALPHFFKKNKRMEKALYDHTVGKKSKWLRVSIHRWNYLG
ncbi:hypothetical protein RDI58_023315 [Solanum bulbocastanum]|uniref:DDE Tnp4 domain-containing protein n=1 Tax=Solanum bulbocastanum TaxID=147425 RepID=A0AAN8TCB8_SOLBU